MLRRCLNSAHKNFHCYGGRGITVCDRWRESFAAFLADMGPRPSSNHTLDRINVNSNYEPSNCRWVTWDVQRANRRPASEWRRPNESQRLAAAEVSL